MSIAKIALAAATALTLVGVAGAASAETPWESHHPRQDQVLDRVHHQELRIREERREHDISPWQAHRMWARDQFIARQDHRFSRWNGGYITRGEQHRLNWEENHLGHHIPY
jgi:hypothetical protein